MRKQDTTKERARLEAELVQASRENRWDDVAKIQEVFAAADDPEFEKIADRQIAEATANSTSASTQSSEQHPAGCGATTIIPLVAVALIILSFVFGK